MHNPIENAVMPKSMDASMEKQNIQEVNTMTFSQAMIMAVWFVASCGALIWLLLDARKNNAESAPTSIKDREKIIEMLATVGDQFSLSIYKKAYKIGEKDTSPP